MSDLTPEQREQIADACDAAFNFGDTWIRFLRTGDESMLLPVVAQMLADERERIAREIVEQAGRDLHMTADDAARIARGQA